MKTGLIGATLLSVLTATAASAAVAPAADPTATRGNAPLFNAEGASGGSGVRIASAAASTLLFVPDAKQSALVQVGEGGEGGRGRRRKFRAHFGPPFHAPAHGFRRKFHHGHYGGPYYRSLHYGRGYYGPGPYYRW
jgi:hypothetical protein